MKRPRSTKATRSESGQVLVIVSLIIVTLIACTALASDVGFLRNLRRQMQTAADAAAIAGAREIFSGNDGEVNTAAATDATTNGFTNGVNAVTVTINNPPTNSSYSNINGNAQDVEVIINKAQPTFFMRAMGISTVNVAARSVAGPENSPYCVYLLSPNASPSLNLLSLGTIQASCGLVVDSTSNSAIQDFLVFINDTSTGVVGGISGFNFLFTPTPVTGIAPIGDPLAALAQPTPGSCLAGGPFNFNVGLHNLNPGTYCGGIQVAGSAELVLQPGTYILDGGGLSMVGASIIQGTGGVTFFNTGNAAAYNATTNPTGYAPINMTGFQGVDLVAPTTGNYAGILFMQDRNLSFGSGDSRYNNNMGTGLTIGTYQGTLYFPTTGLTWNGVTAAAYTLIVAQQLSFNFGIPIVTIGNNFTSLPNGSPIKTIGTLE
jgi:hypothetical protein